MNNEFLSIVTQENLKPKRLLHVGASAGQEVEFYSKNGIEAWHIEALPDIYKILEKKCLDTPGQHAVHALLSDTDGGDAEFHVANNQGQSSSLLRLGRHALAHPAVKYVDTIRLRSTTIDKLILDGVLPADFDFLLIDAQGAELLILNGATKLLESGSLKACQIETAVVPLYLDGATYLEVAEKLANHGLYLRTCSFNASGWTNALFMRPYWPLSIPESGPWSVDALQIMMPKPSPRELIRIGGTTDGAYLLPNDLDGVAACFSPGVSNRKDFEDELLDRFGILSHLCDYSSDEAKLKTPLKEGQTFKKKWLGAHPDVNTITLGDWIAELSPDPAKDLILQMDIEGAEYQILIHTPEPVLRRFRIIIIELHKLAACRRPQEFALELGPVLALMDKHFICVHAHPNNCCGEFSIPGAGLNIPNVLELTFLRRDRFSGVPHDQYYPPLLPHPLDIPANVPRRSPLFLNEYWLIDRQREPESTIKMLTDQVEFLTRELAETKSQLARLNT